MTQHSLQNVLDAYLKALIDTDKNRALAIIREALEKGHTPEHMVFEVVLPGIEQMAGSMVSGNMVTLSQHFLASQIAEEVSDRLVPLFTSAPEILGRVVIGTSHGDFHGLGKKIVIGCLKASMFDVIDLGINVAPERFLDAAIDAKADVIGISSMMLHTATGNKGPKMVRQLINERGMEKLLRLIVGGAPYRFHHQLYLEVGADAWAETAVEAPAVVGKLVQEIRP